MKARSLRCQRQHQWFSPVFDAHTRTLGLGTRAGSAWSDFRALSACETVIKGKATTKPPALPPLLDMLQFLQAAVPEMLPKALLALTALTSHRRGTSKCHLWVALEPTGEKREPLGQRK